MTLSGLGSTPLERRLSPNATQVLLQRLDPGQDYQLTVTTQAGGQGTESSATARTGTKIILQIQLTYMVVVVVVAVVVVVVVVGGGGEVVVEEVVIVGVEEVEAFIVEILEVVIVVLPLLLLLLK